jgi:hypothetical protein
MALCMYVTATASIVSVARVTEARAQPARHGPLYLPMVTPVVTSAYAHYSFQSTITLLVIVKYSAFQNYNMQNICRAMCKLQTLVQRMQIRLYGGLKLEVAVLRWQRAKATHGLHCLYQTTLQRVFTTPQLRMEIGKVSEMLFCWQCCRWTSLEIQQT